MDRSRLTKYAWLSVATALATITLKAIAYVLTGSVGLLSDAVESLVNLAAGILTLAMLTVAARPPDEDHLYGHTKAEYLASTVEGGLVLLAGLSIAAASIDRLIWPRPLTRPVAGLMAGCAASALNLVTARILIAAGRRYNSIALQADGQHLMADVWTSAAVLAGIGMVALTGWARLDPAVAILVSIQIMRSAYRLLRPSIAGLMDSALPTDQQQALQSALQPYREMGIRFHQIRTRRSGPCNFIDLHVLVPGAWTVHRGHHLLEQIESDIRQAIADSTVHTHLEPLEDPNSFHVEQAGSGRCPTDRPEPA